MSFQIEGYTLDELIELGNEVQRVGNISVSGPAVNVGKTFIALGLFEQLASQLKSILSVNQKLITEGELIESDDDERVDDDDRSRYLSYFLRGKRGTRLALIPELNFFDIEECLPIDPEGEHLYLIRWDHKNGDDFGHVMCVFEKNSFWTYVNESVVGEEFKRSPNIRARWAVIF